MTEEENRKTVQLTKKTHKGEIEIDEDMGLLEVRKSGNELSLLSMLATQCTLLFCNGHNGAWVIKIDNAENLIDIEKVLTAILYQVSEIRQEF